MTRDNSKRKKNYKLVGMKFSDGVHTIEIGQSYQHRKIGFYVVSDDVWQRIKYIFDNLMSVKDVDTENQSEMISVYVENVKFEKVQVEDGDQTLQT